MQFLYLERLCGLSHHCVLFIYLRVMILHIYEVNKALCSRCCSVLFSSIIFHFNFGSADNHSIKLYNYWTKSNCSSHYIPVKSRDKVLRPRSWLFKKRARWEDRDSVPKPILLGSWFWGGLCRRVVGIPWLVGPVSQWVGQMRHIWSSLPGHEMFFSSANFKSKDHYFLRLFLSLMSYILHKAQARGG